jgi:hypothetical protein
LKHEKSLSPTTRISNVLFHVSNKEIYNIQSKDVIKPTDKFKEFIKKERIFHEIGINETTCAIKACIHQLQKIENPNELIQTLTENHPVEIEVFPKSPYICKIPLLKKKPPIFFTFSHYSSGSI